jgi:hypothetical protein
MRICCQSRRSKATPIVPSRGAVHRHRRCSIDRAVALQILEAVSNRAVEAAIFASDQVERSRKDIIAAVERELEAARYEASLAGRRYELVDPQKRHVTRECPPN